MRSLILVFLTLFGFVFLKRTLDKRIFKDRNNCGQIKNERKRLLEDNAELKKQNLALEETAEETVALFDITKNICKSLEEEKVFEFFKAEMNRYIKTSDCKFIKEETKSLKDAHYKILPLEIDKTPLGYLAVSGVKEAEEDKFNILAQQFLLGAKRAHLYQKIQELAITDSLTGSLSRGFYMERFKEELERSEKFRFNFSLLMADIDHFKQCNDNYGHLVGDAILKEVAKTLKENIRQIDLIGRYGGEEFSIILIETDKEGAKFAAERIRQALEARHIRVYDEDLKVTVSIGISTYPGDARDVQALIERADEALYQAKQGGRNRVCVYGDDAR